MTTSRLTISNRAVFLLALFVVALLTFGMTKLIVERGSQNSLPAIEIQGDRAAAAAGALDVNRVSEARLDTVVVIEATIGGEPMNGTGVVVDATEGLIVTASHVVKSYEQRLDASMIVARFHAGDEVQATVAAIDQLNDLAILKIDPRQVQNLQAAPLGDSDRVLRGTSVLAIGNPLGYDWTVTTGVVSNPHVVLGSRINVNSDITDAIQHDSAINTGNSGGPLFNARGEVIGITQQIATRNGGSVGLSFSVAANLVHRALNQLHQTGASLITYADIGLTGKRTVDLTPQLAAAAGIAVDHGAMVQNPQGAALRSGIRGGQTISHLGKMVQIGDVIVQIAGQSITSTTDLNRVVGTLDSTAPVKIVFYRTSEKHTVTLSPIARAV